MMVPSASILVGPSATGAIAWDSIFSKSRRIFRTPVADIRKLSGTTYSCVATYEGNNVEIIANEQGSFTTPSFVSFTADERLIGEAAKNQAAMNPRNTVFDVKYVIHQDSMRCISLMSPHC
jgi:hypothetical protein